MRTIRGLNRLVCAFLLIATASFTGTVATPGQTLPWST
jgi:hypothetical protein